MTYALPSFRLLVFPKTLDNQIDTASPHNSADWTRQENWWTFTTNASFPGPIKSIGWIGWKNVVFLQWRGRKEPSSHYV